MLKGDTVGWIGLGYEKKKGAIIKLFLSNDM